jgi:hypothetical protein
MPEPLEFHCDECESWYDADLPICPFCSAGPGENVLARGGPFAPVARLLIENYPAGVMIPITAGLPGKGQG